MSEVLVEVHEVTEVEAVAMVRANWHRFLRCRWVLYQNGEGWDIGMCVNKDRLFDWTDDPQRSGVYSRDHLEDEEEVGDEEHISRVLRCLPGKIHPTIGDKMVTVVLERE